MNKTINNTPRDCVTDTVTAAICISSVALYGGASAVGLVLSAVTGVIFGCAVKLICNSAAYVKLIVAIVSISAAVSASGIISQVLGMTGLMKGVFTACAVGVALTLGNLRWGKIALRSRITATAAYSAAVTVTGVVIELLGKGSVFGMDVPLLGEGQVGIFTGPAGSMIMCAITAAVTKYVVKKTEVCGVDGRR
ncbi:MAG: hypothetical protein IKV40_04920 [Clostridia bacterium]|nr:hypothetical protein [Clostridia bacterium]